MEARFHRRVEGDGHERRQHSRQRDLPSWCRPGLDILNPEHWADPKKVAALTAVLNDARAQEGKLGTQAADVLALIQALYADAKATDYSRGRAGLGSPVPGQR